MGKRGIFTVAAACLGVAVLAACGTGAQHTATHSSPAAASSHPPAAAAVASTAPASPAATVQAAAVSGNVKACQALETHPAPETQDAVYAYMSFLSRQSLVATDPQLQSQIQSVNAGLLGAMAGTVTVAAEQARAVKLQAMCTGFGVKAP